MPGITQEGDVRAPSQEPIGTAGASDVSANFERIGWAPVPNAYHDLGTDLLIAARDHRRFDVGLVVGVQVKAGPSWFSNPGELAGEKGWWFYEESTDHFDYWVTHGLPHILVLHNLVTRISNWVHVTAEACFPSPLGCKIFVPASQTVDHSHLDELLRVARTQRASFGLEGTAFSASAAKVSPSRRIRFALLIPRLVAPHRNAGVPSELLPESALALVVQGRYHDLHHYTESTSIWKVLSESKPAKDWRWELVRSTYSLRHGDLEPLENLLRRRIPASAQAAMGVLLANAYYEAERLDDAESLLSRLIDADNCAPTDQSWLLVQRARVRLEAGSPADARLDAIACQRNIASAKDDASASVLAGSSAWLLFIASTMGTGDIGKVIEAADNAAGWWRRQSLVGALDEFCQEQFDRWTGDRTVHLVRSDEVVTGFSSAILTAGLASDIGSLRAFLSSYARIRMLREAGRDPTQLAESMTMLRRSGDSTSLKKAASKLWRSGPVEALTATCLQVDLSRLSRTTVDSSLKLLKCGADCISDEKVYSIVDWTLSVLEDEASLARLRQAFDLSWSFESELLSLTSELVPRCGETLGRRAASLALSWKLPDNALLPSRLDFIRSLSPTQVLEKKDAFLSLAAVEIPASARAAILGALLAAGEATSLRKLTEQLESGDFYSLTEIGDVRSLNESTAQLVINRLSSAVKMKIDEADSGRHSLGMLDVSRTLCLFNISFKTIADWPTILDFLSRPSIASGEKIGTCVLLKLRATEIDSAIRRDLLAVGPKLKLCAAIPMFDDPRLSSVVDSMLVALGDLDLDATVEHIARLMSGQPADRGEAAFLIGTGCAPSVEATIIGLIADDDPNVRASAASAVGSLIALGKTASWLESVARRCCSEPGTLVTLAFFRAAESAQSLPDWFEQLAHEAAGHSSAQVRASAGRTTHR